MRQLAALILALCGCGGPAARSLVSATEENDGGTIASADGGQGAPDAGTLPSPPSGPSLAGCPMFPADNPWNRDISAEPVDPHSADYLAYMGVASLRLHPDFGGPYGQPFVVVPAAQRTCSAAQTSVARGFGRAFAWWFVRLRFSINLTAPLP